MLINNEISRAGKINCAIILLVESLEVLFNIRLTAWLNMGAITAKTNRLTKAIIIAIMLICPFR
jgi:hypothetical protein